MKINAEDGNIYIIEDIDDEHVLIQESKHAQLKARLNAVRVTMFSPATDRRRLTTTDTQRHRPRTGGVRIGMIW
jgi:hypothetical protein